MHGNSAVQPSSHWVRSGGGLSLCRSGRRLRVPERVPACRVKVGDLPPQRRVAVQKTQDGVAQHAERVQHAGGPRPFLPRERPAALRRDLMRHLQQPPAVSARLPSSLRPLWSLSSSRSKGAEVKMLVLRTANAGQCLHRAALSTADWVESTEALQWSFCRGLTLHGTGRPFV